MRRLLTAAFGGVIAVLLSVVFILIVKAALWLVGDDPVMAGILALSWVLGSIATYIIDGR